ncbi:MAG: VWA domain-containing protein [Marinicellaceae bacterium]
MKSKSTLLLSLLLCSATQAEQDTMIVFDSSGSMWGQLDGKTKIEIARDAVNTIAEGFKADQSVGLMAYGHRKKGDCSDIEILVNPSKNSTEQIKLTVNKLKPKGKTPLSQAVKMAAEKMNFTENKAEVVLITDGVETCGIDTCANALELEQMGIDFTTHVIGFGLSADQGKQVSCLADITGGQYVLADDAASLNSALEQVIHSEEIKEVEDILPDATITAPSTDIVIGADFTVQWTGPDEKLDYIDIVKTGNEKTYGEITYAWTKDGNPSQLKAPGTVGTYDLRYIWQGTNSKYVLTKKSFNVIESDVSLVAPASVNAAEYFEVEWKGPNRKGDYVDLVKKDNNKTYGELSYFYTESGTPGKIQAPAASGEYDLRYIMEAADGRQILYRTSLNVKQAEATVAFEPTAEVASNVTVYWTGPNNKDGYVDIVKSDSNRTYGEISYFYLKENPDNGELLTPVEAGDYKIRFIISGADGRKVLASSPITINSVNAALTAPQTATVGSTIEVQWNGPNRKGDYVDLVKASSDRTYGELSYFYTASNPQKGTLTVPKTAGEYKIRYVLQGKQRKVLSEQMITVN